MRCSNWGQMAAVGICTRLAPRLSHGKLSVRHKPLSLDTLNQPCRSISSPDSKQIIFDSGLAYSLRYNVTYRKNHCTVALGCYLIPLKVLESVLLIEFKTRRFKRIACKTAIQSRWAEIVFFRILGEHQLWVLYSAVHFQWIHCLSEMWDNHSRL